jgi:DNA-binding transcriptional regulator GbsR (MarR family)
MNIEEAKEEFIQLWGTLGSQWGISRTMAQLHALLLLEPEPLSADDVMERLQISRGNTNQNMRALMDWGLVYKQYKPGERKEFFVAERDIWTVARQIMRERRKRELEPVLHTLQEVGNVEGDGPEAAHVRKMVQELREFLKMLEQLSDFALRMEKNAFLPTILKLLPKSNAA